jgi:hypothetical protein
MFLWVFQENDKRKGRIILFMFQAPFMPWVGFATGALLAFICRLEKKQIYTISIETGGKACAKKMFHYIVERRVFCFVYCSAKYRRSVSDYCSQFPVA